MKRRANDRDWDRELAESDLVEMLLDASLNGALEYHAEIAPDGRTLDERRRAVALARLDACAACVVTMERERELVRGLRDVPVFESLMLLRVMQQGLVLALSDDLELRAQAIDGFLLLRYGRVAHEGWKAHLAANERRDA